MADHQRIREEMARYFQPNDITECLNSMRKSATTELEKETIDKMFVHHVHHLMSETEPRIRRNSVSSETSSNENLVQDENVTPTVTESFPIYDKEGKRCGTYEFLRWQNGQAKCSEDACRKLKKGSLQTLKCHALKKHNIRLDAKKKKAVISEAITCNVCGLKFTRKQTLVSHLQKYHKPPVPTPASSVPDSLQLPVLSVPEVGYQQSIGALILPNSGEISPDSDFGFGL